MRDMQTLCPAREVPHAGNSTSPGNGDDNRTLRVLFVGTPGGLTSVVQTISALGLPLDHLEFDREPGRGPACLVARYRADERMAELLRRKLSRLVEVFSVDGVETGA
jgi:hypothetical protein